MIWETKGTYRHSPLSHLSLLHSIANPHLGLTLEQVDRLMEEVGSPRRSAGWQPHGTYAHDMGKDAGGKSVGNAATGTGVTHQEGVEKAYATTGGQLGGV